MRTGAEGAADRASVSDGACPRCRAGPPRSLGRTRRALGCGRGRHQPSVSSGTLPQGRGQRSPAPPASALRGPPPTCPPQALSPRHPVGGPRCQGSPPTLTSSLGQEALAGHRHELVPGANPGRPQRRPGAPPTAGPGGGKLYLGRHQVQGLVPPPSFCWFVYLSLRLFPPSQVPSAFRMTQGEAIQTPPPPPPGASGHRAWA